MTNSSMANIDWNRIFQSMRGSFGFFNKHLRHTQHLYPHNFHLCYRHASIPSSKRSSSHCLLCIQRTEKNRNCPKSLKKKLVLQVHVFTQLQRNKRNNGNKSWAAEVSDLKSPGREDEQGWRELVHTPCGALRTRSTGTVYCTVKWDQDKGTLRWISQDLASSRAKCFPCKLLLELPEVSCQDVPIRGLITEIMGYLRQTVGEVCRFSISQKLTDIIMWSARIRECTLPLEYLVGK